MDIFLTDSAAPLLAAVAFCCLFMATFRPDSETVRAVAFAAVAVAGIRYFWWRLGYTVPTASLSFEGLWPLFYVAVELVMGAFCLLAALMLVKRSSRGAEADAGQQWVNETQPLVDVLIPTYSEGREILERTILGAVRQNYPRFRVWVLDDGRRPWLNLLATQHGAGYLVRDEKSGAKAGNMNAGLAEISRRGLPEADFIAVLDADFVAFPDFLQRTAALMRDSKTAVVQTPQHFFNSDPVQRNLEASDSWPDEQRFFFDVVMPSRDAWGNAFCCGTSAVVRAAALKDIGGFPTESITEDMLLSLKLAERGWNTVYLNEKLSMGLAPEGIEEYRTQRSRWCSGFMQIFAGRLCPFSPFNKLSFAHRIGIIDSFVYWALSFPARFVFLSAPILFWFTGATIMKTTDDEVLSYCLPWIILSTAYGSWVARGRVLPILTDVGQLLFALDSLRATLEGLAAGRGLKFKVTPKGRRTTAVTTHWGLLAVFGSLLALTVSGTVLPMISDAWWLAAGPEMNINLVWSIYNCVVLVLTCAACIERPRLRGETRFETNTPVTVIYQGKTLPGTAVDLSLSGARLALKDRILIGDAIELQLRTAGRLEARVVRNAGDGSIGILFTDLDLARRTLARRLFSGQFGPDFSEINAKTVIQAVVRRLVA